MAMVWKQRRVEDPSKKIYYVMPIEWICESTYFIDFIFGVYLIRSIICFFVGGNTELINFNAKYYFLYDLRGFRFPFHS